MDGKYVVEDTFCVRERHPVLLKVHSLLVGIELYAQAAPYISCMYVSSLFSVSTAAAED
jgi:hypothetical protein